MGVAIPGLRVIIVIFVMNFLRGVMGNTLCRDEKSIFGSEFLQQSHNI